MSCPNFDFSPGGRRGVGVLQARSGLDYPFVNFTPPDRRATYPVRAICVGGKFELRVRAFSEEGPAGPPFFISNLLPTWPDTIPIEQTLPVLETILDSAVAQITVSYLDAINDAIAQLAAANSNWSIALHTASIEVALVDNDNFVVGWGANSSYEITVGVATSVNPVLTAADSFFVRWLHYRWRNCAGCEDSPEINPPWRLPLDNDFRYLVADFYLAYENDIEPALPLRVKHFYNFGCAQKPPEDFPTPVSDAGLIVVDANDVVVFDSITQTLNYDFWDWGADYTVFEWRDAATVCRLLIYKTWAEANDDKRNYSIYLTPHNAVLDSRTLYKIPKRVQQISVKNGATITGPFRGDVDFNANYNTTIEAGEATATRFVTNTGITFNAVAGSGAGKYPCDDGPATQQFITSINGLTGDENGGFILSGADCLWARRPTVVDVEDVRPAPAAGAQIGADCKPCCACEDYASTALYMNSVRDRYKLIGTRAEEVRSRHETNIGRWNEYRLCSTQTPLRLIFVPQRCPYMDIVMLLCNPCESCMPTSVLTLTLSADGDNEIALPNFDAEIECGYTAMYAAGINGKATSINAAGPLTYTTAFPQLQPGDSAYVKFRLKFSPKAQYVVRGTLTGTYTLSGLPITTDCNAEDAVPAQAETSQMLYCTPTGKTEMPC